MSERPTSVLLLRHAATASNLETPPRLQGQGVNRGLSDEGRAQLSITAAHLASLKIDAVYASPLLRSQETAAAIAAPHGLPVEVVESFIEADVGRWEGKNWREIAETDSEAHRRYQEDAVRYGYPEGENLAQIHARMLPAMTAIASRWAGQRIVIVGHGMANRSLLAPLLGLPLTQAGRLPQDNCGVNVLSWISNQWKVVTLNSTLHLAAAAR